MSQLVGKPLKGSPLPRTGLLYRETPRPMEQKGQEKKTSGEQVKDVKRNEFKTEEN